MNLQRTLLRNGRTMWTRISNERVSLSLFGTLAPVSHPFKAMSHTVLQRRRWLANRNHPRPQRALLPGMDQMCNVLRRSMALYSQASAIRLATHAAPLFTTRLPLIQALVGPNLSRATFRASNILTANELLMKRSTAIEMTVYETNGGTTSPAYRTKMRSLYLNLKGKENPSLREGVVSGDITVARCRC